MRFFHGGDETVAFVTGRKSSPGHRQAKRRFGIVLDGVINPELEVLEGKANVGRVKRVWKEGVLEVYCRCVTFAQVPPSLCTCRPAPGRWSALRPFLF